MSTTFCGSPMLLSFAQAAAAAQAGASVVQIFVGRLRVNLSSHFLPCPCAKTLTFC